MTESPQVVFVPGFMQHADTWSAVADAVGERYPSEIVDFTTWTFEPRLAEIRDAAPEGAVLVGYSMGGRLALHAAVRDPARYRGLVTVGSSPGIEDGAERAVRRQADEELADWIENSSIEEVVERWEALPVFATQSRELVVAQRAGRLRHSPGDLATLLRSAGQGALPSVWGAVRELPIPVLALAGAHDGTYRGVAQRLAEGSPLFDAAVIADAGHAAHLEQPGAVADHVLAFIGGLVSS